MRIALLFILAVASCSASVDEHKLLRCIAMVEGGVRDGTHGEKGAYQMSPDAVRFTGGYGYEHAMAWLRHLERELSLRGVDLNYFNLALTWNAGITNVLHAKAPIRAYDYAYRTATLSRL